MSVPVPTLEVERELWQRAPLVIGIDEVGRGALAGPVTVGAFALARDCGPMPPRLRDSKRMTALARTATAPLVHQWGTVGLGHSSAVEIDEIGIVSALALAARRALEDLYFSGIDIARAAVLLDGSHDWLSPSLRNPLDITVRPKADRDCASVAAAACAAKVHRDELMIAHDDTYPGYGWARNKGYAAAAHLDAIAALGPSALHRKTWLHERTLAGRATRHPGTA